MSILEISIILHYWCSPKQYKNMDAPAVIQAIDNFVKHGILLERPESTKCNRMYCINEPLARPYIDAVTSVPLPVKSESYFIPDYKIKMY